MDNNKIDGTIYKKLSMIQTELKVPKDMFNSFGKYKYRNAEQILKAIKPICQKYGCAITICDSIDLIGNRYYVKSTVTLYDVETAAFLMTQGFARESETKTGMDASQITGAATSYARKYALGGMFGIDDGYDADAMDNTNEGKTTQEKPKELGFPEELKREVDNCATLKDLSAIWKRDVNMKTNKAFKEYVIAKQHELEGVNEQ